MKQLMLTGLITILMLALTGCGFHLRGTTVLSKLPDSLGTIYIQGVNTNQGLGRELKRNLINSGASIVDSYAEGSAILTIVESSIERRMLTVDTDAKVSEYELRGIVRFSVSDISGELLVEDQQVERQRDYQFDKNQVLSSEEEERLLREQLNQQLVQAVLRRLFALK